MTGRRCCSVTKRVTTWMLWPPLTATASRHGQPRRRPGAIPTPPRMRVSARLSREMCSSPNSGRSTVVGAPSRMPTSSELCFAINSGAASGVDGGSPKALADRVTCDGQQALRRCRSHSPSGHQPEAADLFPDGRERGVSSRTPRPPLCPVDAEAREWQPMPAARTGRRAVTRLGLRIPR
jgi:hypothetical protein